MFFSFKSYQWRITYLKNVGNGQKHDTVHHRVVLEMNVVDAKQAKVDKVEQKQRSERLLLIWLRSIHLLKGLTNPVNAITEHQVCKND